MSEVANINDPLSFQEEMDLGGAGDARAMSVCMRTGCTNTAVDSDDWDREYCSNECVATHCRCVEGPGRFRVRRDARGVF